MPLETRPPLVRSPRLDARNGGPAAAPTAAEPAGTWHVIVPVKRFELAKTRLAAAYPPEARAALARGFAADVLAAVRAAASVRGLTVVGDARAAADADEGSPHSRVPVHHLAEPPTGGLRRAIALAAGKAERGGADRIAVLLADLPALRAAALDGVLAAAAAHDRSFVADANGTGTTFAAATVPGVEWCFGPDSAARHRRNGFVELAAPMRFRRDVDGAVDLAEAARLGIGPGTLRARAAALAAIADAQHRPASA
ncbi:2-phospho-L-lactate guanylyltransferase [Agromyces sp. LHK192]|uniref:2-phospho-L-lactate guanylyltransferase n=1 Tax=Agromyces sp. LHK192 TaxID=2498704 RepID=UPI00196AB2EA|nr:2-phospho-L-lactate guanylyltransferase [Agromyces sp. LHK192]